jgi:dystonin
VVFLLLLQSVKDDLEALVPEKDVMQEVGEELIGLIGEPDKPEVERNIEDIDTQWKVLNDACKTRQLALESALHQAAAFQEELMV